MYDNAREWVYPIAKARTELKRGDTSDERWLKASLISNEKWITRKYKKLTVNEQWSFRKISAAFTDLGVLR